jgi:hypothetical protein
MAEKTPPTEAELRRERLAAELRANLARRKQQARARRAAPDQAPHPDTAGRDPSDTSSTQNGG